MFEIIIIMFHDRVVTAKRDNLNDITKLLNEYNDQEHLIKSVIIKNYAL